MMVQKKSSGGSKGHGATLSEINITPLVDVILVLLIIFMVTAPLLSQGLDIQLPEASAPAIERTDQDVTVTIDKTGRIFLQNDPNPYRPQDLEDKLAVIFERREKKDIFIRADKEAVYGTVVEAMALAKKAGVERIGMVTEEEKEARSKK